MKHQSALDLKYIKTLIWFLRIPGVWPSEIFGEKIPLPMLAHRKIMSFHSLVILGGGLYYLRQHQAQLNFLDMGQVIITTCLAMITGCRSALINTKGFKDVIFRFINYFHLIHFTHVDPYNEEIYNLIHRISTYYTRFMASLLYIMAVMFNATPTFNNIKNKVFLKTENYTVQYTIYLSFPGINLQDYAVPTSIYNVYCSFSCSIVLCGFDLLMYLMIVQIIGHVLILKHNLESFRPPKNKNKFNLLDQSSETTSCIFEVFDAAENKEIHNKLMECVKHHKIIIDFTDELSAVFGPMLAVNYLFHLFSCCLLLLECSQGGVDALLRYGPLTITVFGQLFQMSIMFELLGAETEKIIDSIYCVPWECMDVPNQRTVCIILHKMQDKISIKAMGLAAVGVSTMTAILKTTFSYYAFLLTVGKE